MHSGQVLQDQGGEGPDGRTDAGAEAERLAQGVDAIVARRLAVGPQHRGDGLAVPELLEGPERHERRRPAVLVGPGGQQVPQVARRVVLDVVHVPQATEIVLGQPVGGEPVDVEVVPAQPVSHQLVPVQIEAHAPSTSPARGVDAPTR